VASSGRSSVGSYLQALRESVDRWPMAITSPKTFGDLPKLVTAPQGVTGARESPLERYMLQAAGGPRGPGAVPGADHPLGNSVGATG